MKKSVILSVLLILAVLAAAAAVTYAYFSNTKDTTATITTAKIAIGNTDYLPVSFINILPGETISKEIRVCAGGTRAADLYFQMVGSGDHTQEINFCHPTPVLDIAVYDLDLSGSWFQGSICNLYPGQASSVIPKIGEDVEPGQCKNLRIDMTLLPTAGNDLQNGFNTDTVHLIAVQFNGPAPVPDKQGFPTMVAWPDDDDSTDDDPYYP